ncbi:MAG: hypothetical protein D6732_25865 [Methanobacteriota archaeon]|nr:MAG: hypothetical protein D6732_25865 [Euryarchaeota archaeon]
MSAQIISKAVGIDLGTTNSAVGIMDPTDMEIIIHREKNTKRETTPSCVWKDPQSGEIVIGHKAFRRIGAFPVPIRSIKRSMGKQIRVLLTDEEVSPEQVSAYILAEMKRQIEEDIAAWNTDSTLWIVDRAIVTVPAYFDQPQIDATRRAGEMAGLEVIDLLHEPTAAACYYCWKTETQDGIFLVYDFGGGTFDVSILRSTAGRFEVLGISGNNRLGGDDIDTELARDLQERLLQDGYALELNPHGDSEDALRFDLLKFLAESVKKALSHSGEYLLRDSGTLKDKEGNPVIIETMYERSELEEIARPIVERTIPYCFEALEKANKKAGITLGDVDAIILAGGSTHIPLVRKMVQDALCFNSEAKEVRAKCIEPVYDKVDTIVALGAAIRAAAIGGLAIYNEDRSLRVSFRGTASVSAKETHIGGQVEALNQDIDVSGGRIRLSIPDLGYEDEDELGENNNFAFRKVPLQASAENLLTFEIFDSTGKLLATAGRAIRQVQETPRPTGGSGSTAVLSKPLILEVMKEGKVVRKELISASDPLPAHKIYQFAHPGNTQLIRLPLYQLKRKIQEILVEVSPTLPKGTPIELDIRIDEHYLITVKGQIGDTSFNFKVEPPPPRKMPTEEEIQALHKSFSENCAYLPPGKKALAEARYKKARKSFESSYNRGDNDQAIHDFEEMEEIVASISSTEGSLQPPREFFDELVKECLELNSYVARAAAESGYPHDQREVAKAIEAQRVMGEKALANSDQKSYSDVLALLESIRNNLIGLGQKFFQERDTRTDIEKATDHIRYAEDEASKMEQFAASQEREDLKGEIHQIKSQLKDLSREAQKNPKAVQEKIGKLRARLEQIKNILMGKKEDGEGGKLVEDISS